MSSYEWKDNRAQQLFKEALISLLEKAWNDMPSAQSFMEIKQKIEQILNIEPENENSQFWSWACKVYCELAINNSDMELAQAAIKFGEKALSLHETKDPLQSANLYILYESLTGSYFLLDNQPKALLFCQRALDITQDSERMLGILAILKPDLDNNVSDGKPETAKKSGCFIATAAYGTTDSNDVKILQAFRDKFLLNSKLGTNFVQFYYSVSPDLAKLISASSTLKYLIRNLILRPVSFCCRLFMEYRQNT